MSAIGTAGTLPAMRAIRPSHVTQTPPASAAARLSAWPSSVDAGGEELLGIGLAAEGEGGGNESQRDHGRAGAEAALVGDAVDPAEASAGNGGQLRKGANADVVEIGLAVSVLHLELVPEVERDGDAVEAGADVCRARRRADADPHWPAAAIASGSGSTTIGDGVRRSTISGSFNPWPVITHTTRVPGSRPGSASAAREAAEAGSQKTPSSWAKA